VTAGVSGERFGFSRCKAAGADETEQKHLLITFAAATLKIEFMEKVTYCAPDSPKSYLAH